MLEIETHFIEIKYRIYYISITFITSFCILSNYSTETLYLITNPIQDINLIYTNISELFWTLLGINTLFTIYLTLPILVLQIWLFLIPGLYQYEKTKYTKKILFYFFLFYLNTFIAWKWIIPIFCNFFLLYSTTDYTYLINVTLNAKISEYLTFFLTINYLYIFSFSIPILYIYLLTHNIISTQQIFENKKLLYFSLLIFYAFITPPDILSLLIFIIPIILSLELFLFILILQNSYKKI